MCLVLQTLLQNCQKIGSKSATQCPGMGPLLAHQGRGSPGHVLHYSVFFPLLWCQYKYRLVIWEQTRDLFFTGMKFAGPGGFSWDEDVQKSNSMSTFLVMINSVLVYVQDSLYHLRQIIQSFCGLFFCLCESELVYLLFIQREEQRLFWGVLEAPCYNTGSTALHPNTDSAKDDVIQSQTLHLWSHYKAYKY